LVKDGFHDLLYYLNRINDPQFSHWETGVRVWLATNSVDLSRFALAEPQGGYSFGETRGEGVVEVNLASPQNGAFVGDDIPLLFEVRATNPISKIEVYFNGLKFILTVSWSIARSVILATNSLTKKQSAPPNPHSKIFWSSGRLTTRE